MDPCGTEEESKQSGFLPEYENVNQFMQQTLKAVLQATKASNELPSSGDDFDYYSSFQGFQDSMDIEGKRILHMIQSILKHQNVKVNMGSTSGAADIEDKLDLLMDANDQILERVGSWLDEASGIKKNDSSLVVAEATPKHQTAASWNKKSPGAGNKGSASFRLLSARNIQRPQLKFKDKVDNRNTPFVPVLRKKWNAQKSLEESLRLPEDVDTEDLKFVYPHPYKYEIDNLQYMPGQMEAVKLADLVGLDNFPLTYISTVEGLQSLLDCLKKETEIAVDLEHHSYRTFQGITCLMQVSTRSHDYLVDTLELRSDMHILNEVFTDPQIVKVFHGADSDIDWLQRDFGLYVVNMFDTGQAARVMSHSRFSLAHLLQHYCDVEADKKYQLADWRIRPLPEELQKYAREDTHYLLYIYDRMKNELLERGNESKNLLKSVLHRSCQICLKVFKKPSFSEEDYMDLYRKNKKVFNSQQLLALKEMYAWRDETARLEDESCGYVLPNHMMLQICDILPRERQGILACCNPIPPLVRQYLSEIFIIVNTSREAPLEKVQPHRPTKTSPSKHPSQDMDSLLQCPHDLSHVDQQQTSKPVLLDSSFVPKVTTTLKSLEIRMAKPLLTVFDSPNRQKHYSSELEKKIDKIKASFINPYLQYLPEEGGKGILSPAKLKSHNAPTQQQANTSWTWRLLPNSGKRKERQPSGDQQISAPPSKRSRTDLHEEDKLNFTEDDKKALPQDIDTPLRFQVPANKKKNKKNKNRDVEIMESVQKHLANIRKIQEENEFALGQEPIDVDIDVETSDKQSKQTGAKPGVSKPVKDNDEGKKSKSSDPEMIVVEDDDEDESNGKAEFQPYDYTSAAEKVLQGKSGTKLDYFDPQSKMKNRKGSKVSKNKMHSKKGKSFTWKS